MAKLTLTPQQQAVVENRGGSLLVSAAAGSGKTKVLVDRLFLYITQDRCNVDDFLIITYTKAAAAELRGKIAAELSRRLGEDPGNQHLRRQLLRVYQADIKTVDAFCTALLRENTHLLAEEGERYALTADFKVLDDHEASLLRRRVLDRVLESFYQELDEGRTLLADTLGAGRDDSRLAELVLEIHEKLQSHADPEAWLSRERDTWRNLPERFDDTPYAAVLLEDVRRQGAHWASLLRRGAERTEGDAGLERGYGEKFRVTAAAFDALSEAPDWEGARSAAGNIVFPRLTTPKGRKDEGIVVSLKQVWESCKDAVDKLEEVLDVSGEEAMEDLTAVAPAMVALLDLTEQFSQAYRTEKLRRGTVDFSDQEHLALRLLVGPDSAPTELGRQVSARYREILVDEYQDTNEVQNAIFRAVSREERNIFTVGDVKQSIYRFRLADPTIFLEKYSRYPSYEEAEEGEPRKILLSENFRSRPEILAACNQVFSLVMRRRVGGLDYTAREALRPGRSFPPLPDCPVELHCLTHTGAVAPEKSRAEAQFVAGRIREMLAAGTPVTEGEGLRPMRPGDVGLGIQHPLLPEALNGALPLLHGQCLSGSPVPGGDSRGVRPGRQSAGDFRGADSSGALAAHRQPPPGYPPYHSAGKPRLRLHPRAAGQAQDKGAAGGSLRRHHGLRRGLCALFGASRSPAGGRQVDAPARAHGEHLPAYRISFGLRRHGRRLGAGAEPPGL